MPWEGLWRVYSGVMTALITRGEGAPGYIVLLRHGQTVWSESGQHTGRTDIPLTAEGERQARDAGVRLHTVFPEGFGPGCVFSSPLKRARMTAELTGYGEPRTLEGIAEWDYGRAEGRTRQQVAQMAGFPWNVWSDGPGALPETMGGDWFDTLPDGERVPVHNGPGETLEEAAARARGAIEQIRPLIEGGHNVLLVAHAHILRILTSQWLGMDPHFSRLLRLDTAHYCVLSVYKGDNVIERWNA